MSTVASHIELRPNRDGHQRAYIAGTRVRVQDVAMIAEVRGASADEIVRSLPHLTLSQVHAALAYFFEHREAIVQEMRDDARFVDEFRRMSGPGPLAARLGTISEDRDAVSS